MSHIPVNHHLRPLYRVLVVVTSLYLMMFGVVGLIESEGSPAFGRQDTVALGLRTNLAFAVASVAAGGLVLLAVLVGRNVYYMAGVWGGVAFLVVGMAMLALLNTDLNILNFSMATVIVSFTVGLVLFAAGLYGRSGPPAQARAEEAFRHSGH